MHLEILNNEQLDLLPFIKKYIKSYYLVGRTAIALHIGNRRSIDYDLFAEEEVNVLGIKKQVAVSGFSSTVIVQKSDQIHFTLNSVKLTFFQFPFSVAANDYYENYFRIPDLLSLTAMKAFALGGRGKLERLCGFIFYSKTSFQHQKNL